ncbi:MAG: low molecular weight phosphotyrosine protein phosphatase [Prevotella sp.]|nr:low molecular weight phosphotyrosine protein phosphatase [Prevotella sp.]
MNRTPTDNYRHRILFICLGNICRSPAAHAVMQHLVDERGCAARYEIDSAGIGNWHVGQLPDRRMREHGARRGYRIDHHARQFDARTDFDRFDHIVVMDEDNYRNIISQAPDDTARGKVIRMADHFTRHPHATSVPDPYYGGPADFELALDLIEDGCEGILASKGNDCERMDHP